MARIIYTGIVESIRGSISGTTFQRNRYGFSVKAKPKMTIPNSHFQARSKQILSFCTRKYRDITQNQRDAFDAFAVSNPQYAKNNPSAILSGYNVCTRWWMLLRLSEQPLKISPSFNPPAADELTFSIIRDGASLLFSITSVTENEDWIVLLFSSSPIGEGVSFIGTKPRYCGYMWNITGSNNIADMYRSSWGRLPEVGERLSAGILLIGDNAPVVLARQSAIINVVAP